MARLETLETFGKLLVFVMIISIILHPYTYTPKMLHDRMILVTDASSIIGEEMTYQYCKVKTKIMMVASDQYLLANVSRKCQELGAMQVETMAGDLANATFRQNLIQEAERRLGGLDHLLMNHQADLQPVAGWLESNDGQKTLDRIMELEFTSYMDLASRALPLLEKTSGKIGVVSSLIGRIPVAYLAPYSASRAALLAFMSALRQEHYQRKSGVTATYISVGHTSSKSDGNAVDKHNPFFNNFWSYLLEDVSEAAIAYVEIGKPEITYPFLSQVHSAVHSLFPNIYEGYLLAPYLSKLA